MNPPATVRQASGPKSKKGLCFSKTLIRAVQSAIMRDMESHQTANHSYIEEEVQLLELAHNAHILFETQPPSEKRKTPGFRTLELHLEMQGADREISEAL